MLKLNGQDFTTGAAKFLDEGEEFRESTPKIYVRIEFPGLESLSRTLAQLDTGAAWSVLRRDLAEALGVIDGTGEPVRMRTAAGVLQGRLERVPLILIADEGISLTLQATFFVSRQWPGGTFLGYTGLLDKLRIALDSPANQFYFGEES
jgi:hypothetical protein